MGLPYYGPAPVHATPIAKWACGRRAFGHRHDRADTPVRPVLNRRVAALLRDAGWQENAKRVEGLRRREGHKVPMKQPKKGRHWRNGGSCVRLRPEHRYHVWSYDFVHHRPEDGGTTTTPNGPIVPWAIATCTRGHRTDGPKADHALIFNMDHSDGAAQRYSLEKVKL